MKTGRYIFLSAVLLMSCDEERTPIGPIANFGYTIDNLIVSFSDSSVAGEGVINKWLWDFGDDLASFEQNPVHTYAEAGAYSVKLTVTDDNDLDDVISKVEL